MVVRPDFVRRQSYEDNLILQDMSQSNAPFVVESCFLMIHAELKIMPISFVEIFSSVYLEPSAVHHFLNWTFHVGV